MEKKMPGQFIKTIKDVHVATGIPEDGSGQRLIRNPIRSGKFGVEGIDWIKSSRYLFTQDFFDHLVKILRN